jgi:hypothetical protein
MVIGKCLGCEFRNNFGSSNLSPSGVARGYRKSAFQDAEDKTVAWALARETDAPHHHPKNNACFNQRKSATSPQPTLVPSVIPDAEDKNRSLGFSPGN